MRTASTQGAALIGACAFITPPSPSITCPIAGATAASLAAVVVPVPVRSGGAGFSPPRAQDAQPKKVRARPESRRITRRIDPHRSTP